MPLEENQTTRPPTTTTPIETRKEELQMLLANVTNSENNPTLTTEQVTELIAQRSKINEYIREDKKDQKEIVKLEMHNKLHYLYVGAIAIVVLCGFVLAYKPEYFSQLLQAIVTTLGGYGLGKYQGKKENSDKE